MNLKYLFIPAITFVALITGCTPMQPNIALSSNAHQDLNGKTVAIVKVSAPEAETHYTGQIGLLDYAIIAGVNSGLDKHLKSLTFDSYDTIETKVQEALNKKGFTTKLISPHLAFEVGEDFKMPTEGKSKIPVEKIPGAEEFDYLLVLRMTAIGTSRSYYGPAPTSEPVGRAYIVGEIFKKDTKDLLWFHRADAEQVIPAPWDESDKGYPNLTNAVYQALEKAIRMITANLEHGQPAQLPPTSKALN